MKIAIVAPSSVPFTIGGAENLYWGLQNFLFSKQFSDDSRRRFDQMEHTITQFSRHVVEQIKSDINALNNPYRAEEMEEESGFLVSRPNNEQEESVVQPTETWGNLFSNSAIKRVSDLIHGKRMTQ